VRQAAHPDALLLGFFQETYAAAADLAQWDRKALERNSPLPAARGEVAARSAAGEGAPPRV
jgi:hypothetical protein